jgi:DNA-binding response OmpR family regulator
MGSVMSLAGRSILVVEDDALIAIGLKELFEAEDARVSLSSNSKHALQLVERFGFSAAVLDCHPVDADYAELRRALCGHGIPFMFYTGYDDVDEGHSRAPLVTKPASAVVLIATVAQLLKASSCDDRVALRP